MSSSRLTREMKRAAGKKSIFLVCVYLIIARGGEFAPRGEQGNAKCRNAGGTEAKDGTGATPVITFFMRAFHEMETPG